MRLVDRVIAALGEATGRLMVVVAAASDGAEWAATARIVADLRLGQGALGGVHSALVHAGEPVLAVAWDMPGLTGGLLRALRAEAERTGADAVVPWSDGPLGFEPASAWYAPRCIQAIERRLDAGDRRAGAWLDDVRTVVLDEERVRALGDPRALFANVNTPADLEALERNARSSAAGSGE